jgi:hypothetical protein
MEKSLYKILFLLILSSLLFLSGCRQDSSKERMLFDFESNAELDRLQWSCHTLFSLSNDHAVHGLRSLKMDLFPSGFRSNYMGLDLMLPLNDWRGYKNLSFDVYNPSEKSVRLTVRIDDRKDYPDYGDRYNKGFIVTKGGNHLVVPLDTMVTSGVYRHLDLARISRLLIFMSRPEMKTTLYIDAIQLLK